MSKYQEISVELERFLSLRSKPLAVKMLQSAEEVPEGAIQPLRGHGPSFIAVSGLQHVPSAG